MLRGEVAAAADLHKLYLLIPGISTARSYRIAVRFAGHEISLDTITGDSTLITGCPFFLNSAT